MVTIHLLFRPHDERPVCVGGTGIMRAPRVADAADAGLVVYKCFCCAVGPDNLAGLPVVGGAGVIPCRGGQVVGIVPRRTRGNTLDVLAPAGRQYRVAAGCPPPPAATD